MANEVTPNVGSPVGAFPVVASEDSGSGEVCDENCVIECDTLINAADAPLSHSVDGQTTVNRPLSDMIALDNHLRNKRAVCQNSGNGWGAVAKSRVVFPSASGEC